MQIFAADRPEFEGDTTFGQFVDIQSLQYTLQA